MCEAQHGDATAFKHLTAELNVAHTVEIYADREGYISQEKAMGVGIVAMKLGAGRATKTDTIDFEAGINLAKKWVTPSKR